MGKAVLILRKREHTNSSYLLHLLISNFKCSHSLISDLASSCEGFSSLYSVKPELLKAPLTRDPVCVLGFKGRPWAVSRPVSTRREGKKSATGLCIGLLFFPLFLLVFLFRMCLSYVTPVCHRVFTPDLSWYLCFPSSHQSSLTAF